MRDFVGAIARSLALLGPGRRGRWLLLIGLAIAMTGFEAIGAMLIYVLLSTVGGGTDSLVVPVLGDVRHWLPAEDPATVQLILASTVGVFFIVRAAVSISQRYIEARVVHNAGARLSTHLMRGYLVLPYLTHTQLSSAELVRNAFDSVQSLVREVLKPAVQVVAEFVLVVGLTIVLLTVAPVATLIAFAVTLPATWLLQAFVQPRLKQLGRRSQDARRATLQRMQQALGAVRDVRLHGRHAAFGDAFASSRRAMARADYLKLGLSELPRALIETVLVLVIVVIFVIAVVVGGETDTLVSTLGVFAYAGLRLQPSLRKIVQGLNHVRFGTAILDDLTKDRERVDQALDSWTQHATSDLTPFGHAIEVRNVTFHYSPDGPAALRGVDLVIRPGEFIGICGPTGGGKSTLVDLITGLLEPTQGRVVIDGRDLGPNPLWWYEQLGVVSQSVALIDDTLRRNIAFGLPDDQIDEFALEDAIERAQLRDVILGMPQGLNTVVGERGVRLSGGQRQRVAIARALYRRPSVIIFDEGTSALDSKTEAALVMAIDQLRNGRTLISIAHRIATVRDADRIVVVDDGRIVADGSHDDLLRDSALFRTLAP